MRIVFRIGCRGRGESLSDFEKNERFHKIVMDKEFIRLSCVFWVFRPEDGVLIEFFSLPGMEITSYDSRVGYFVTLRL